MNIRNQYNRDGYFVARDLLGDIKPPKLFDCFNRVYHQNIETYKSYLSLGARLPSVQKMFLGDEIHDMLRILGLEFPVPPTHPVLNVMGLPIPGGYNGTTAHQDWPSVQGSLDMCTVWVPFQNISKDNYPLEVIPGSHRFCVYTRGSVEFDGNVLVINPVNYTEKSFVPIECEAGDVVFMSGLAIHRTGPGVGFRVAASMRFDNAAEPTFIERGYPCAQKRVVDREIKWVPTIDQVRSIYAVD